MAQERSRQFLSIECDESTLISHVCKIASHLERLQEEEPKIITHFEEWRKQRQETIETIAYLQKKLNKIGKQANIAKCVGATAGLVGVASGIAGAYLGMKGHELAGDLKLVSTYSSGTGLVVCTSSAVLEAGLSHKVIKKIKKVLRKDVKATKQLKEWVYLSKEVDNLMDGLFQCNITSSTFINVFKVCQRCIKLLRSGNSDVEALMLPLDGHMLQTGNLEGFEGLMLEDGQKVFNFLKLIKKSPKMLQPLGDICSLFRENPQTFDFVKIGTMLFSQTYCLLKPESLEFISTAMDSIYQSVSSPFTIRCALDTIAIGSRFVSIIFTIKKIKKGKSKYSKALDELQSALSLELTEVTRQIHLLLEEISTLHFEHSFRNLRVTMPGSNI